ncbi:fructose bisphosphate aldolase [Wallemia mellicola]|nr:fructose bisphosphate aldolase [Wallemia mellicola]
MSTQGYSFAKLSIKSDFNDELKHTAHALVQQGKGIYATDETTEAISARLAAAEGVEKNYSDDEQKQRRYEWRKCLYETLPTDYISGCILYQETLVDFNLAGVLADRGIIPGVRIDTDCQPLPGAGDGEVFTQGLDDLTSRCRLFKEKGARFTKWRAPILVNSSTLPTELAIDAQATSLARMAAVSQSTGLVPIVEPDLDFSGDASLERSLEVHTKVIAKIYEKLAAHGVYLEGTLLKPSFVQPGASTNERKNLTADAVGEATALALSRAVPSAMPGVVFLSGGLSDTDSIAFLSAANKYAKKEGIRLPPLTFSFGRGLQGDAMEKWTKKDFKGARQAFEKRAQECSKASLGQI